MADDSAGCGGLGPLRVLERRPRLLVCGRRIDTGWDPLHATLSRMGAFTGRVHGSTIDLDAIPNAPFEGQRVRVVLELVDEDVRLNADEQASCWSAWIARGFDGPIEDEGEPELP